MEAAIRFSRNSAAGQDQTFLHVDVTGKVFKLCRLPYTKQGTVQYDVVHSSNKAPPFRAFDWHPVNETLVVVGQSSGEGTLLNIAEGQQDSIAFNIRSQRLCNAVALNSQNLFASGLDKVRTDFCLNVWDFNQRLPAPGGTGFSKSYADPIHKLAAGEPITSLKFFHTDPQLLIAGVKGQFVRLYDLREPGNNNGFQFPTRCVSNLAIDWLDENYFASCYPINDPSVCLWDRRMVSRSNSVAQLSFGASANTEQHASDVPLEMRNVIDVPGAIWSLRFSKSKSGCLGILSSTGHLKVYNFGKEFVSDRQGVSSDDNAEIESQRDLSSWENSPAQDVYLEYAQDVERGHMHPSTLDAGNEKLRTVSFDFLTSQTRSGEARIVTLSGNNEVKITSTRLSPQPTGFSSTGFLCKGNAIVHRPNSSGLDQAVGNQIDRIRRKAEPLNILKKAFRQNSRRKESAPDLRRMSSLNNQAWNSDLGFFEKESSLTSLLLLTSVAQLRCEAGYLLNPEKNQTITTDSHWLQSFWSWIERATRLSRQGNMVQDNLDLSYLGVYGFWMEDVPNHKNRLVGPSSTPLSKIIENLVERLEIPRGKMCSSEYTAHRQICLHVAGVAWSEQELDTMITKLVRQNQFTKAAALALFSGERTMAYKALKNRKAHQSHKMLAMAIAGATRHQKSAGLGPTKSSASDDSASDGEVEDDWSETVAALAEELTDPYARAILAYVKSGDWSHVVSEDSLPLKYRVGVALRHYADSQLTHYISLATKAAVSAGDIEGVILTGSSTREAFELMSSYITRFGDLQTAVLALCPAIPRYLSDSRTVRKFESWKETYRSQMNSWGLKFDRVRFDIGSQKLAVDSTGKKLIQPPRPQVKLVCGFCTQPLPQFDRSASSANPVVSVDGSGRPSFVSSSSIASSNATMIPLSATTTNASTVSNVSTSANTNATSTAGVVDTAKHPLSSEKVAAIGVVCPKCGRHLPRCGVCDKWLGTPDETFLKWYSHTAGNTQGGGQQPDDGNTKKKERHSSSSGTKKNFDLATGGSLTGSGSTIIGPTRKDSSNVNLTSNGTKSSKGQRNFSPHPKSKLGSSMISATTTGTDSKQSMSTSVATIRPNHSSEKTNSKSTNPTSSKPNKTRRSKTSANHAILSDEDEIDDDEQQDLIYDPSAIHRQEAQEEEWNRLMARFTVFCVKCHHGFHAAHARMWFGDTRSTTLAGGVQGGSRTDRSTREYRMNDNNEANGEKDGIFGSVGGGRKVCPVPSCKCLCNE